jgi:nucleoside-triphosphatase
VVLRALPEETLPNLTTKILVTGRPGSGKTTLIKRLVNELGLPAAGFYTEEIRKHGQRVGFKIVTVDGEQGVFAHVDFDTPERVGKYGLHLEPLETVGVAALREAVRQRRLAVVDEIGPMEIRSTAFCEVVKQVLEIEAPILGTITVRSFPFTNAIKKRRDITVITVGPSNRDQLVCELSRRFHVLTQRSIRSNVSAFWGAAPSASLSKYT